MNEEQTQEQEHVIIYANRKPEMVTELHVADKVYIYELINTILLLMNKLCESKQEDISEEEVFNNTIEAIKTDYKIRFLSGDDIIGEENESEEN